MPAHLGLNDCKGLRKSVRRGTEGPFMKNFSDILIIGFLAFSLAGCGKEGNLGQNTQGSFEQDGDRSHSLYGNWRFISGHQLGGISGATLLFSDDFLTMTVYCYSGVVASVSAPIEVTPSTILVKANSSATVQNCTANLYRGEKRYQINSGTLYITDNHGQNSSWSR